MAPPVPSRRVAAALALALALATSSAALAQADAYKPHMDNGVKLYADRNYAAAIAEFQAAYEARPNANPLVNIALCDKEMFRYPEAIAALVTALAQHGASMDAGDRAAAEQAIKEMRALLGTVTVTVQPPEAAVLVDGEATRIDHPIPLGPGKHKITARAEGYAVAEQTVNVTSGRAETVSLELVAEMGRVTIEAPDARMTIAVDDRPRGNGAWTGMLAPGQHVVRMYGPDGQPPYAMSIQVLAGVPLLVRRGEGGVPILPPKREEPLYRGPYVLGLGSLLFAGVHPALFTDPRTDYGAGYGLRGGYQVNKAAGFDLTYEHSSISTYSEDQSSSYRIIADRIAVGLRLISPGHTVRFVGNFGVGFVVDEMTFNLSSMLFTSCTSKSMAQTMSLCPLNGTIWGVDAFALVESGAEIDINHVLLDFLGEAQFQSTGNLTGPAKAPGQTPIYGSKPLVNGGPAIRIGYRFW